VLELELELAEEQKVLPQQQVFLLVRQVVMVC
jgi:hypothetical protein